MPNIIGEPFKPYVASQINIRQKAHGSGTTQNPRTPEYISYLNSKTAWVKLASGISIDTDRTAKEKIRDGLAWTTLAKNNVLFGGISRLEGDKLKQRGTYADGSNNVWDYYKGTYNVSANKSISNENTGDFGLAPMPGITGVEIKCLNRGSIKRAEVTLKCYTPEQFQIIDLLYLRIGYTMFLEWGWSPYLDNKGNLISDYTTLIEDTSSNGWFSDKWKTKSFLGFLPVIEGYRRGKNGNYDGLLCKVVNFSWTFNQDGSYDITLSLISLGDVVESLKLNIPPSKIVNDFINQSYVLYNEEVSTDITILPSPSDNIISSYLFLQKIFLDKDNNNETGKTSDERADIDNCEVYSTLNGKRIPLAGYFINPPKDQTIEVSHPVYDESPPLNSKEEAKNWIKTAGNGTYGIYPEVNSSYVDPDSAEEALSDYNYNCYTIVYYAVYFDPNTLEGGFSTYFVYVKSLPSLNISNTKQAKNDVFYLNYNNGENDTSYINDSGFYMRFGHLLQFINDFAIPKIKGTNIPLVKIDFNQWSNYMYHMPYQVSFDPRVCIVKGGEIIGKNSLKNFFPTLPDWKNPSKGFAYLMNIYVNHNQILSSLNSNIDEKGNIALFDFLQDICNELNKALGGVNNLEVILDEEINTIKIIDGSYNPNIINDQYILRLYGYDPKKEESTFVKNFNLKTEITNDFATMATVGSTAGGYVKGTENTMFSKWNKGLIDRFKEELIPGDPESIANSGSVAEPNDEFVKNIWEESISAFGYVKLDVNAYFWNDTHTFQDTCGLSDEVIDKNVTIATEFFKYCQSEIQKQVPKYGAPTQGFIPISLSITMEGISGIKIYNAVKVDTKFLPQNYPEALKFIIKGVNHSLKENIWETTIETVVISQNEE